MRRTAKEIIAEISILEERIALLTRDLDAINRVQNLVEVKHIETPTIIKKSFGKFVIPYSDKKEYLNSSVWKKRRSKYFDTYLKRCVICDEYDPYKLALHHVTYERLGNENIETDLVCLCHDCHKKEHIKIEWDNSRVGETAYLLDKRVSYEARWAKIEAEKPTKTNKKRKKSGAK